MQTLTNSANYGATLAEAEQHLRNLEPFHTGTLSGAWDKAAGGYIVKSYGQDIAFYPDGMLTNPYVTSPYVLSTAYDFSRTTSKHANLVKKAWGL